MKLRKIPSKIQDFQVIVTPFSTNSSSCLGNPRFKGITSDLFPGVVLPEPDFGALTTKLGEPHGEMGVEKRTRRW